MRSNPMERDISRGPEDPEECLDMANQRKQTSEAVVREIRRRTRRKFSLEEKIRIVLEGLRGEQKAKHRPICQVHRTDETGIR